jgi:hypothetical protein
MSSTITVRQVVVIVFAVLTATVVASYDKLLPHQWQTYTGPDGIFSIELPEKPTVETNKIPMVDGTTKTINIVSAEPTKHTAYSLTYFEDESLGKRAPDEVLESAVAGSLAKVQGTALSKKAIEVQGHPALEMQARARGNSLLDSRTILVGNRIYMVMAVAMVEQDREPKTVERILNSFKILK